ncbi:leuABCD operon attenuation leader peptide, LeuL [Shewanella baltica OS223]|nr:leuABCD operon attenuation leader peptide, LeuL [Shewanella baltica OS223]
MNRISSKLDLLLSLLAVYTRRS